MCSILFPNGKILSISGEVVAKGENRDSMCVQLALRLLLRVGIQPFLCEKSLKSE